LVRHRLASYSQQSQRYVKESEFDYVIPPSIEKEPLLKEIFEETIEQIQNSYNKILDYFKSKGKSGEKVNQDARFLLPGACETKIVVSMNCRELIHFFKVRLCSRAQWEIRNLAQKMLEICCQELPAVFKVVGAKCDFLGYCPEGDKFSCGRYPTKDKFLRLTSK
jgi:thymidylate synthase (FAD)